MEIAKFVHQSINHSLPMYFQFYFHKVSMTHKRCTRSSSDKLSIPLYLTNRAQRSIKYQGSKTWNSIPAVIRCLKLKLIPAGKLKVFSKISRAVINFIS